PCIVTHSLLHLLFPLHPPAPTKTDTLSLHDALPIFRREAHPSARRQVLHQGNALLVLHPDHPSPTVDLEQHGRARVVPGPRWGMGDRDEGRAGHSPDAAPGVARMGVLRGERSEERRVGKECRSWWGRGDGGEKEDEGGSA